MCEQIAPYLQLQGGDLLTLAKNTVEDRFNLIHPVLASAAQGKKDYGSNWILSKGWAALEYTGIYEAPLKKVADDVVNGWATGPIVDSFTGHMAVMGSRTRTPGRYTHDNTKEEVIKLGLTNEMIHPSVGYRKEKRLRDYDPPALKGFERKLSKSEGFIWTDGETKIPEYVIKPTDVFTRHVALNDSSASGLTASNYIGKVDRAVGAKTPQH
jgi:hypothetical protein